jgi:hypothetical protein
MAKPKIGSGGDGALASNDVADALRRNTDVLSQSIFAQAKWFKKFFFKHFARGDGGNGTHNQIPSVIINNFDVFRTVGPPDKTDPPLIVNTDTVLPFPVILQCLQVIAGRYAKII